MFAPEPTMGTPPESPRHRAKDDKDDPKRLEGLHPLINNPKYLGWLNPEGTHMDSKGNILIPEVLNR